MQGMFEMEISTDTEAADWLKQYMQSVIREDEKGKMRICLLVRSYTLQKQTMYHCHGLFRAYIVHVVYVQVRDYDDMYTRERSIGYTWKFHDSRHFRCVYLQNMTEQDGIDNAAAHRQVHNLALWAMSGLTKTIRVAVMLNKEQTLTNCYCSSYP